jgi:hypothetical protein
VNGMHKLLGDAPNRVGPRPEYGFVERRMRGTMRACRRRPTDIVSGLIGPGDRKSIQPKRHAFGGRSPRESPGGPGNSLKNTC